ncbi:MAG: prepilin-type N-terminal cleavage/methylation domain-containing protein [Fimbriimonadaceae bacterium]
MVPTAAQGRLKTSLSLASRRSGFTLIEVSTVIVVLVLIVSVLTPRILAMQRGTTARATRANIVRLGTEGRALAIDRAETVVLRFDNETEAFLLEETNADGESTQLKSVPLGDDQSVAAYEASGSESNESDWRIEFYPDGTSSSGAWEIEEPTGSYSVRVFPANGHAEATEGTLADTPESSWEAGSLEQRGT